MNTVFLGVALLAAGCTAAPAIAAEPPHSAAREDAATVDGGFKRIFEGKTEEGLRLIEPVLARLEAEAARHVARGERVYSGQTEAQTVDYMLTAAFDKVGAVDLGETLGRANFVKGYALIDLHRVDEAKPFLERAVALSPDSAQYLCELARWHAVRKETETAFGLYQRCLDTAQIGPENSRIRFEAMALRGKGYVLIDMDRLDEAEAVLRKSLTLDPGNPLALDEIGYIGKMRAVPGHGKS